MTRGEPQSKAMTVAQSSYNAEGLVDFFFNDTATTEIYTWPIVAGV